MTEEWRFLKEATEILRPFYGMRIEVGGEKFIGSSMAIPCLKGMQHVVQKELDLQVRYSDPQCPAHQLLSGLRDKLH